jgi:hypothetical protein
VPKYDHHRYVKVDRVPPKDTTTARPSYWAGQIGLIVIATIILISAKGVLSCASM